jgi:hypothetical protein
VHSAERRVVKVTSLNDDPVNGACICAEGRFGYRLFSGKAHQEDRIVEAIETIRAAKTASLIVSPLLPVEDLYAAVMLSRAIRGTIGYLTGTENMPVSEKGRLAGEANVALLHRLGVQPLSIVPTADCLILVGAHLAETPSTKVISIGYGYATATLQIDTADPMQTPGSFLNRDGHLAIMKAANLGQEPGTAPRDILIRLSEATRPVRPAQETGR